MKPPPEMLDGAKVHEWAVSPSGSFYVAGGETGPVAIAAVAICSYPDDRGFYCFKCNRGWEVIHDDFKDSVTTLKSLVQSQTSERIEWRKHGSRA